MKKEGTLTIETVTVIICVSAEIVGRYGGWCAVRSWRRRTREADPQCSWCCRWSSTQCTDARQIFVHDRSVQFLNLNREVYVMETVTSMLMVCRRMLRGTGVFSGDTGTRWQIAAYHGAMQAVSSTRSGLPRQNCAVRNGLFLSVRQQGHHVQPNGGCDVQDWSFKRLAGSNQRGTLAPSCENTWTQSDTV